MEEGEEGEDWEKELVWSKLLSHSTVVSIDKPCLFMCLT